MKWKVSFSSNEFQMRQPRQTRFLFRSKSILSAHSALSHQNSILSLFTIVNYKIWSEKRKKIFEDGHSIQESNLRCLKTATFLYKPQSPNKWLFSNPQLWRQSHLSDRNGVIPLYLVKSSQEHCTTFIVSYALSQNPYFHSTVVVHTFLPAVHTLIVHIYYFLMKMSLTFLIN